MPRLSLQEANDLWQVDSWSDGTMRIGSDGHLEARPIGRRGPAVDLVEIANWLQSDGPGLPAVVRFPQILAGRIERINKAFNQALKENGCKDVRYRGVFPIKVNQRKELVQALAKAGRKWAHGLEVGSKAELLAGLAMDPNRKSMLIVNGFKDKPFLQAACDAAYLKDEVVIVLDEIGELEHVLPLLDRPGPKPLLGIRLKLRSKAPGKWALSGGERAKFGLTIPEVLAAVTRLEKAGHLDRLCMLHFHIGSQISDIRRITQGVREAARIHTELVQMGANLRFIDVGGGMAVDYDGSASSNPNSCNYTMEEYASSIVSTLVDACADAEVPMPDIINESGRAVTAHHAVLLMEVVRRVPGLVEEPNPEVTDDDPTPLVNLAIAFKNISAKNVYESFHDALQAREDCQNLFDLGFLNLQQMGQSETLFRATMEKARTILEKEEETESEEYQQAQLMESRKLVCNFSLFQSIPDSWGVKQQFPILPIRQLRKAPDEEITIADITCDSDGEIRRFIDSEGSRSQLPVHAAVAGEPYVFAVGMVGAYQDSLGDYHNLFGETAEAWIDVDEEGDWHAHHIVGGSRVGDMLEWVRYEPSDVRRKLKGRVERLVKADKITASKGNEITSHFTQLLRGTTYLE